MMTFITAFLWGTGLSLGMCVGLVVWSYLRPWIAGEKAREDAQFEYNVAVLEALQERTRRAGDTADSLNTIADVVWKKFG